MYRKSRPCATRGAQYCGKEGALLGGGIHPSRKLQQHRKRGIPCVRKGERCKNRFQHSRQCREKQHVGTDQKNTLCRGSDRARKKLTDGNTCLRNGKRNGRSWNFFFLKTGKEYAAQKRGKEYGKIKEYSKLRIVPKSLTNGADEKGRGRRAGECEHALTFQTCHLSAVICKQRAFGSYGESA